VGRSRRLYEIFESHLMHSSRNRQTPWWNMPKSLIIKIQDGGGRHIDFRKVSISPGQITGNNYKTDLSLHVVDSVSNDYSFYTVSQKTCDHVFDDKLN